MTQSALAVAVGISPATLSRSLNEEAFSASVRARLDLLLFDDAGGRTAAHNIGQEMSDRDRLLHLLQEALDIVNGRP